MDEKFTSPHEIIRLNIEHYRNLLKTALDEQTRRTVERLFAEEKAKLAELTKRSSASAESPPANRSGSGKQA